MQPTLPAGGEDLIGALKGSEGERKRPACSVPDTRMTGHAAI